MSVLSEEQLLGVYLAGEALIPAEAGEYSSDEAGVPGTFIERAVALRPDLAPRFLAVMEELGVADQVEPRSWCESLRRDRPVDFEIVTLMLCGAYFLNPRIREHYGYPGAVGIPQNAEPQEEFATGGLLDAVRSRGRIYRIPLSSAEAVVLDEPSGPASR